MFKGSNDLERDGWKMTHHIAAYTEAYHDQLVELWLRAVSQTHDFLTEEDIRFYYGMMQSGALRSVEIWMCLNSKQEAIDLSDWTAPKSRCCLWIPCTTAKGGNEIDPACRTAERARTSSGCE